MVNVEWPNNRDWEEWSFVPGPDHGKRPMNTSDEDDPDQDEIGQEIQQFIAENRYDD